MKNLEPILLEIISQIDENHSLFNDPSVENGKMGLALFYFFCHYFYQDRGYKIKGEDMIEDSIHLLSEISQRSRFTPKYRTDSLSNVISSFGKGLLFIQYRFNYGYDFTEYYKSINSVLIELNRQSIKEKDFDFFSGALSAGHFFVNKYYHEKDAFSKNILLEISDALEREAIYHTKNEVFWRSPALLNQVYLGISHGSAMIINFLTKLFEIGVINEDSIKEKQLLKHAINFLMNRKRNLINGYFSHTFSDKNPQEATQFAMCYGDLGILFALYNANKIIQNPVIGKEIDKMLAASVLRKKDSRYTFDGGIFYGASGVFCLFKELFRRSNHISYEEAYTYWFHQIMTYRAPHRKKNAGFINAFEQVENKNNPSVRFSYGWGIAGIGICLMLGSDKKLPLINETLLIGI